jgi:carbon starvation protein
VGKILEASVIGVVCLLLAVWGGKLVYEDSHWAHVFSLTDTTLAWTIIFYGLAASVLPVWLLLAPRDYLSTFMKLGTIFALALGIFYVLPDLKMPALTQFVDGSGPVVAGRVFPFCFITIACGAISGFHTLIASGTTPKIITRESYARPIGYGAMCLESLVAIMAIIAACTLDPGVYLSMNMKGDTAAVVAKVNSFNFPVSVEQMDSLANEIGEKTLFGRTGGAATLAVGMAHIFSKIVSGRWLDLWYHFAIMFEALFILTTIDAGTRVARYILQDFLGNLWKPLADTKNLRANALASGLMVAAWGYFLIQGVRDPLGGINSLWPLFGIANQMLAAIALCLATTIVLKMGLLSNPEPASGSAAGVRRSPALALITLVPLVWLLAATMTAGIQKIWHSDPAIGFLAQTRVLQEKVLDLEKALEAARATSDSKLIDAASQALKTNRTLQFNNRLDAAVAGIFLVLVLAIVLMSIREWILLLARKKVAELRESPPVWLPDYALAEGRPGNVLNLLALGFALVRELSGEADLDRARQQVCACEQRDEGKLYVQTTEQRFNGVRRCC